MHIIFYHKTWPNAWMCQHKGNQLWMSLLNLPVLTLHHQILFSFLAPTTAQIAQRNAYFQASERRPDTVCPFQRVSGIGRAMISSTCRSFVIPWRGWGQASSLAPFCSFTQSAFISLHRNIPFAGDPEFLMDWFSAQTQCFTNSWVVNKILCSICRTVNSYV